MANNIATSRRIIERFEGHNYMIWAIHIKNILRECKLQKYIDIEPTAEGYVKAQDEQALAEIQFTLGDSQMKYILKATTAKQAWDILRNRHLHSSRANRLHLRQQLLNTKMKEKETIRE